MRALKAGVVAAPKLRAARLGLAFVAVTALVVGCTSSKKSAPPDRTADSGPISVAAADPSGVMKTLVTRWNVGHPTEHVDITALPLDPSERRDQLAENLQRHVPGYDVVLTDLTSTAEMAANNWIRPLTGVLAIDTSTSVKPAVAAGTYANAVYAAPLTAASGLLYYRSDLLKRPPATWSALSALCGTATANALACFSGQYAQSPELATNVLELIYGSGGRLVETNPTSVTLDAGVALKFLVDGYLSKCIPAAAVTYREGQSERAFASGSLLMLRAAPEAYAALSAKGSAVRDTVRVARLPGLSPASTPLFGGVGASVNAVGVHQKTAADFIRYLQGDGAQRALLSTASLAPALTSLYDEAPLRAQYPFLPVLQSLWASGQPLPVTANYQAISDAVIDNTYAAMTGAKSLGRATSDLKAALTSLPSS